jgi:hypothetical protein
MVLMNSSRSSGRYIVAALIVAPALGLFAAGANIVWFDIANRLAFNKLDADLDERGRQRLIEQGETLAEWRDAEGLRYAARRSYRVLERELRPLSLDAEQNARYVAAVAPADSWAWLDFARVVWADTAARPRAELALDLAALTAPYEARQAEYRVRFVMARWAELDAERRRRAAYETSWLLRSVSFARDIWPSIYLSLSPDVQTEVLQQIRGYLPNYHPPKLSS